MVEGLNCRSRNQFALVALCELGDRGYGPGVAGDEQLFRVVGCHPVAAGEAGARLLTMASTGDQKGTRAMSKDVVLGPEGPGPIDSVTDRLRSEIVAGVFSPGERLVEADLAQRYFVPRGMAREALAELAKEGLVERQPKRGARVRALSAEEATEISETRFAIEGLCAGHAARNASKDEVSELRGLLSAMEQAAAAQDIMWYYDLVAQLGHCIRVFSRQRSAAALSEQLLNQLAPYSTVDSLAPGRINASLKEFHAIVDAIARADSQAAEAAVREHRVAVVAARREVANRARLLQPFGQRPPTAPGKDSGLSSPSMA